jgi:hypothetical protein
VAQPKARSRVLQTEYMSPNQQQDDHDEHELNKAAETKIVSLKAIG